MDITTAIIASFRKNQPLFCSQIIWPSAVLSLALCEADAETGGKGWGVYQDDCHNFKFRGLHFYAAHWLVTTYPKGAKIQSNQSSDARYPVSGRSVGDESISFSNTTPPAGSSSGDDWLRATSFGQQWLRMRKRAGMGARAIAVPRIANINPITTGLGCYD